MNSNTIKAAVKRLHKDVTIVSISKYKFGIFSVNISKSMPRSTKTGFVMGEWNGGEVKLENISWT